MTVSLTLSTLRRQLNEKNGEKKIKNTKTFSSDGSVRFALAIYLSTKEIKNKSKEAAVGEPIILFFDTKLFDIDFFYFSGMENCTFNIFF